MEYGRLISGFPFCGDTISSSLSRFRDSIYGGFNGRSPGVWRTGAYVYYPQSLPSTNTHRKTYVAYRKVHLDIMFCLYIHPKQRIIYFFHVCVTVSDEASVRHNPYLSVEFMC